MPLPSAIELVAQSAHELLEARVTEYDAGWILTAALVIEALKRSKGNKCRAARLLGVHRNTFRRHLERLALNPFAEDVKKFVDAQLKLFSRPKPDKSCTRTNRLSTVHSQDLQKISA